MNKVIKYAESALYLVSKERRKINAIIKRNQIRRIKAYIMLLVILASNFYSIFAIENPNIEYGNADIGYVMDVNSYIKYNNILQQNAEYFYIKNNEKYTAYCIDLSTNGAESHPNGHYLVDSNTKIDEELLRKIILNSYPYKSVDELGLASVDEAIFASQFAIWCYTTPLDMNLIVASDYEYERVVKCIFNIYSAIDIPVESYNVNFNIDVGEQKIENIDAIDCYVRDIEIKESTNVKNFELEILDKNVNMFRVDGKYKIYVPVDYVDNLGKFNTKINFKLVAKENVALLGSAMEDGYQDVALTLREFFNYDYVQDVEFVSWKSKIVIKKKDKETLEPLSRVEYEVTDEKGNFIGRYVTDENGEFTINLKNNKACKINIKEVKAKEGYAIDKLNHIVEVEFNDNKEVTLFNEKKKGYIQINKKTKEYNELTALKENTPLSNVSFYIYDSDGNIIDNITTDKNGKAITKELLLGKYYIKEYKTQDGYKLLQDKIEVEISYNDEIVLVNILNENVEIPKELPKTGR